MKPHSRILIDTRTPLARMKAASLIAASGLVLWAAWSALHTDSAQAAGVQAQRAVTPTQKELALVLQQEIRKVERGDVQAAPAAGGTTANAGGLASIDAEAGDMFAELDQSLVPTRALPTWASPYALNEQVRNVDASMSNLACSKDVCRFNVLNIVRGSEQAFVQRLAEAVGDNGTAVVFRHVPDTRKTVVYLMHTGSDETKQRR